MSLYSCHQVWHILKNSAFLVLVRPVIFRGGKKHQKHLCGPIEEILVQIFSSYLVLDFQVLIVYKQTTCFSVLQPVCSACPSSLSFSLCKPGFFSLLERAVLMWIICKRHHHDSRYNIHECTNENWLSALAISPFIQSLWGRWVGISLDNSTSISCKQLETFFRFSP